MSNFVKLSSGFRKSEKMDGLEAEEVYLENSTGAAFPTIVFGSTEYVDPTTGSAVGSLVAVSIDTAYEDRDTNTQRKTVRYSANVGGMSGPGGNIRDLESQKYDVGSEVVTTEAKAKGVVKWYWASALGTEVEQPVHRLIPTGNISVPVIKTSVSAAETWMTAFIGMVGKINIAVSAKDVIKKFPIGTLLVTGASGGTRRNSTGATEWAWEVHLSFRIINSAGFADTATIGHWNYLFRPDYASNGGWDAPTDGSSRYMYAFGSIDSILT